MGVLVYSTGIVRNELICGYANVVHTSSSFCSHTHTHTVSPSEDCKTDGAKSGHCCGYSTHFTKKYINSNTEGLLSA